MITYQDMEKKLNDGIRIEDFVNSAISSHTSSKEYQIAVEADEYDRQMNPTIMNFVRMMYNSTGNAVVDITASNNKICSNFFHRLNTQRNVYLLGNGVSFVDNKEVTIDQDTGVEVVTDKTKEFLGNHFDADLKNAAYKALIHGVCFGFFDHDRLRVYPITEFVPLWDEYTGDLRAGIRFWRIDANKPLIAILFEEDGYTKFKKEKGETMKMVEGKIGYIENVTASTEGGIESIDYSNYPGFPVVPLWGNSTKQSTLIGMQGKIDAFDLIRSGFANDLDDCAEIYWIINGANGMDASDVSDFMRKLKLNHIAQADGDQQITPYTQEVPFQARKEFLEEIRSGIYEDFGALDVHTIAAGSTNDHIEAAYQPMDEEADDFEYQIIEFIQSILELNGISDTPVFKRNRISNQAELTQMILSAAEYLDEETILQKLPFVTTDEVSKILTQKLKEETNQFEDDNPFGDDSDEGDEGEGQEPTEPTNEDEEE